MVKTIDPPDRMTMPTSQTVMAQRDEFRKRLYRLMLMKGINQTDLAEKIGVSRQTVNGYLRGRVLPEAPKRIALAKFFGVEEQDLVPGYDDIAQTRVPPAPPTLRWRHGAKNDQVGYIEVNRWVSVATGLKIQELLSQDKTRGDDDPDD